MAKRRTTDAEPWAATDRLISMATAAKRLGISRRTLERMMQHGEFPPAIKIGSRSLVLDQDVVDFIQGLCAERAEQFLKHYKRRQKAREVQERKS